MNTTLNSATPCPRCGAIPAADAQAGLCRACLLAEGAATEAGDDRPTARFEPPPLAQVAGLFPELEVFALIGAGGMGAVYRARQKALDRTVALKLLPAGSRNGIDFATRFNREARALARLNHPNIVGVHEFGEAGGLHYFIMEFVDGANLRQLEKAGRLSAREALLIVPQICDALQYAHDEGVVHRDIKPENVMVDRKGRVKVTDFGLAKIMGVESSRLTLEGQIMGTPHYMAPEQIERPLTVDHRADIYSLGVVLYEMLTGELPLGRFAPPSQKAGVDVRFDEVVHRALEKDPDRRYQRAGEVKTSVETIIAGPATAPQASAATPVNPGRKHLYWAGLPVATEQDGEREINWNGTGVAIGIALLLEVLGLGIVRLTMGVTRPRDPAIQICVVGAIVAVLWSVHRRMAGPLKQPAATPGESFAQRLSRWWRHGWLVLAAIPLVVVVWCWVQITWLEPARPKVKRGAVSRPMVAKSRLHRQGVSLDFARVLESTDYRAHP